MALTPERTDLDVFKGTTLPVRRLDKPNEEDVYRVTAPCIQESDGRYVTVLERCLTGEVLTVSYRTFLRGGEENNHELPGILEEAEKRVLLEKNG